MSSIFNQNTKRARSLLFISPQSYLKILLLTVSLMLLFSVRGFSQGFTTVDFHQAQNDHKTNTGIHTYNIDWVNGILNSTHTDYWEGIGVPQRIVLTGLLPNAANSNPNKHSLRFQVLAEKDKKHAYDFPISWEQAFKTAEDIGGTVNELQNLFIQQCGDAFSATGKAACNTLSAVTGNKIATGTFPDVIGNPGKPTLGAPNVDANITCFETYIRFGESTPRYGDRTLEIRGNQAVSNVQIAFTGYKGSGKDLAEYLLTWESSSDMVMIRFATRLAPGNGRCGYGSEQGAGSISGGPYHVMLQRLDDVDDPSDNAPESGVSLGSQDNQIMSNAIQIPPPQCGLSNGSSGCTNTATSFTVTYTSQDAANAVVKFYFTVNTAGAKFQGSSVSAVGSCTTNNVSVTADGGGSASVTVVPSGAAFTAGSFRVGACVTGAGGSTTCEQPSATTLDEASVLGKVNGTITTAASPYTLNTNQANPTATLIAYGTLNGTQDNSLFSSFSWAPLSGTNATNANLNTTSNDTVTFTPTAAGGGGFVAGLYGFIITATSTVNGCIGKDTVYIDASGQATCPGIGGPDPVCEGATGLTYYAIGAPSPGQYLTYVWSLEAANGASITSSPTEGVDSIKVTAGTNSFVVVLKIRADNGQVFSFNSCRDTVDVVATPSVTVTYNAPACDENTFTLDVVNPIIGFTYSVDQPCNNTDFSSQTKTPTAQSPTVSFTGLAAGDGYVVTVNTNGPGCTATTTCAGICANNITNNNDPKNGARMITGQNIETYKVVLGAPSKVVAVPNPYSDKIRFNITSAISGMGSLELYNMLGQKIATVYEGYFVGGREFTKEFFVTKDKRTSLIYVFKVGDHKVTGKLIGLKQ